jgi:two-component system, chemotaxis family, sensor kinase CheA
MGRLLRAFASEADERLQTMNQELLMLEGTTEPDEMRRRLEALFREAHSLKGAARAVSAERVEVLAHRVESLFELLRDGQVTAEPSVCDVSYRALDALTQLAREATSDEPADVDLASLEAMLDHPELGVTDRPALVPAENGPAPPTPAALVRPPAAAPAPMPPVPVPKPPAATVSDTVRMATSKLDALLVGVGELAVAQAALLQPLSALRALAEELQGWETATRRRRTAARRTGPTRPDVREAGLNNGDWERLRSTRKRAVEIHRLLGDASRLVAQRTAELEDEVRRSRMLPVSSILDSFPRMIRDIAREHNKQVSLVVNGGDTEVDRSLLEQLRAPLTHVVRNSIDHGVEPDVERLAAGKASGGTIMVSASQQGGTLSVEVSDDGAGIDVERIRAKAVERGLCTQGAAERMSDSEAIGLIYRSGFSTAPMITDLSGRGVGLDVVREQIERLHGMIDLDTTAGSGTRFTFVLPLSVSTTPCLLVGVAGQSFALPVTNVSRIVNVARDAISSVEGTSVLNHDGSIVAIADLAAVLGIQRDAALPLKDPSPAIMIGSADRRMAFLVDHLIDLQSVVTKALPAPLYRVRHLSGATILGDGTVIAILNAANLIRTASPQREDDWSVPSTTRPTTVVLLAEDSITTRALEQSILESAGYEVRAVIDGLEAWKILEQGGIDVVVSDVHMSGMDGFELTAKVRDDNRFAHLPVILVTSKDSRSHRERGVEVGADAYIIKGSFEQQNLIDAVARLV